jgi:glucosamine--fructose-6-phosphate aminotransferase (isomerizing)
MGVMNTVSIYDGAEFQELDVPRSGNTGVILLSQSGETKDLHRCIQIAKQSGLMTIGVVNVADSLIARETECGVYLNAGREVAVASTKSFTNQCVVLAMIAVWFAQTQGHSLEKRKRIVADLQKLPHQIKTVLASKTQIPQWIPNFRNAKSMFLLGKGSAEAVAKEGALKIKEVAYIHAEGYSSSVLKHGAFALICDHLPILLLDTCEEHRAKNDNAYAEVKARNAFVLRITDLTCDHPECLLIPKNSTFSAILGNIYVQLLSYYLAIDLGYQPDFPRNLAKVVTVE